MLKFNLSSPNMNITMWKNDSQSKYGATAPKPFSGILPMALEALMITIRNGAAAACIILPVFLSYCILGYGANLASPPMSVSNLTALSMNPDVSNITAFSMNPDVSNITAFSMKPDVSNFTAFSMNPEGGFNPPGVFVMVENIRKSLRPYVVLGLVRGLFSCAITIIFLVTTISLASESYTGKIVNTKELFSRSGGKWKSPLITGFYMVLLYVSVMMLFFTSVTIIFIVANGFLLGALILASAILWVFGCLYVTAVWMMSLVVSILEEGSSGLKAIDRAGDLMRGKRLKGCAIQLIFLLSCGIISLVAFATSMKTGSQIRVPVLVMIPLTFLVCVAKFVFFVTFTVFYHECRKWHEAVDEAESKVSSYDPIASVEP